MCIRISYQFVLFFDITIFDSSFQDGMQAGVARFTFAAHMRMGPSKASLSPFLLALSCLVVSGLVLMSHRKRAIGQASAHGRAFGWDIWTHLSLLTK